MSKNTNNANAKVWTAATLAREYDNDPKSVRGKYRAKFKTYANEHTKRHDSFAEGSPEYDRWFACLDMAKHERAKAERAKAESAKATK